MSEIKTPRFKVRGRRYSNLKQTPAHNAQAKSTDNNAVDSSLPEGEDFYRQMFERNRAVKLVVDPSTAKIIKANQAAYDFYGYTAEQFKSLRVTDISVVSETELLADMKRTSTGKGRIFEGRHRLASGEIRDVEIFSGALEFNGKPYLYAIIQDITESKRAEKALHESEALYRLFTKSMPNSSVVMFNLEMRYMLVEGPFLKRVGAVTANMAGKLPQEILPDELQSYLVPIYKRALQGESFNYERVLDDYAYQAFVTPVHDEDGHIVGGMILSQDITERKRIESALPKSEALDRLLTRNIPNSAVFMFDHEMRYTLADGPFLKRFGNLYDHVVGKTLQEALPESAVNFLIPIHQRALQGESFSYERVLEDYAYQAFVTPIRDEEGHIVGGMILSQDITERKRIESALRKSEARFRSLVELAPVGIIENDAEGKRILCNDRWYEITGTTSEDSPVINYDPIYPDDVQIIKTAQQSMRETGIPMENIVVRYQHADGKLVWVSGSAKPIFDERGTLTGYIGVVTDVTAQKRLEEELRASEARFHSLVDLAPVGIIQTDLEGRRVFCNSHWCEMTGITLEQALGDVHFETIYPDDRSIAAAAWDWMMESNLPFDNVVFRYQRPDQSTIWVSGNGRPLFDTNGKVTGYLGTVTDITDHKQLEAELITSHTRFRNIIDFAPVGIVETNVLGEIMLVNMEWSVLSGIAEFDAFNDQSASTIHPDDWGRIQAIQQESVKKAIAVDRVEYRFLHPDGKVVWVSDSSRPILDDEGNVSSHIITMTDITERKRLEEALRQNEERLKIITNNIQDLITQTDSQGVFVFLSPSCQMILGYEPQSLIGQSSIGIIHPDDMDNMNQVYETAFRSGKGEFVAEARLRHIDGHYISVETVGKFLYDDLGNYSGGVFISRDVSERKRVQNLLLEKEKLQGALDKESELSSLKTRMMERIAHEFRTPLTVIQAATETLTYYHDRLTPDQRNTKESTIKGQIQRLTDMLQEIGIVINGSFSPERVRRTSTDVTALCRELASELEKQLNCPGKYQLDLTDIIIANLDPHVTKNAIMHIMRNAARFSAPSSLITVNLTQEENGLCLQVIDTGIGIPSPEQERLFQPFFRGSNIGEISGLGIGLTIARAAIEAQDGTIEIKSVVEQGTTVTICFPTDRH